MFSELADRRLLARMVETSRIFNSLFIIQCPPIARGRCGDRSKHLKLDLMLRLPCWGLCLYERCSGMGDLKQELRVGRFEEKVRSTCEAYLEYFEWGMNVISIKLEEMANVQW